MTDFLTAHYLWLKAFHIVAVVAWMAGLLYLPRLFVYHADAEKGSELSETLKIMERRLLRIIMNPAFALTFLLGGLMLLANPALLHQGWMHAKILFALLLAGFHHLLGRWRKDFLFDRNRRSGKFYRKINEVPTIGLIVIVIMVVVRPF
jgi:protoporphyrinogen IX oxidase